MTQNDSRPRGHVHLLTTDAGRTADGSWQPLPEWNATLLMCLFRERLLTRLIEAHRLEDTAAYLVRNPLSPRKRVYLDGQTAVPLPYEPLPGA